MSFEQNEAALTRAVDAWNSGDVDSYLDLYDERIKLHTITYDFPDKSSVAEMYRGFFAATSDLATRHSATGTGCARGTRSPRDIPGS